MKYLTFFALTLSIILNACGSSKSATTGWQYESDAYNQLDKNNPVVIHKIIYNAYINLTVKQIDSTNLQLKKIATDNKGYEVELGSSKTVIKVEHQLLNNAIQSISLLGKVDYKNIVGQDVTEQYLDLKMRLENAVKSRERYLQLLNQAENVQTALSVEKELERITLTIEQLEGKIKNIDRNTHYATITINLKQKKKLGPLGFIFKGVYLGVKWLFVRG
jgi:hypothetical protein